MEKRTNMKKRRVAVLIVNWNKEQDTLNLLSDLDTVNNVCFDIFMVDNASTDNSVNAVKKKFPHVTLILNQKNLGGTGGFNKGLNRLSHKHYEYIWMLDNDARIRDSTLKSLLEVMNLNSDIGLAGSRIQDIDEPSVIVETGSNFRWDTIGVIPVNRNSKKNPTEIIDVDYVAVCSALVRTSALKKVGVMDERMFLCWDDMDWGLCFKQKGYRVVCVTESIVYHGSFTERDRGDVTNYYYGIRNALLTYSKHTPNHGRIKIFLSSLRFYLKLYFFFRVHKKKETAGLIQQAIFDFYHSNWGRFKSSQSHGRDSQINTLHTKTNSPEKILISLTGASLENSMELLHAIKQEYPQSKIHILISSDRKTYFESYTKIMINNRLSNRVGYLFRMLKKLYKLKYDIVVTTMPTPFIYAASMAIFFDTRKRTFSVQKTGFLRLYKIILSLFIGEFSALLLLPFVLKKSKQYKEGII